MSKTDWVRILLDLRMRGCSTRKLARLVEAPYSTIQSLMIGHEPRHSIASRILQVHAEIHEKDAATAAST